MSVLFYPESIRILGSDANGNNVMLCEMAVDDIANLPAANAFISDGYVLSMGCVATAINDNSKHRLNGSGTWVQIAAGTSTYTRAEIDTMFDAVNAELYTKISMEQLYGIPDVSITPDVGETADLNDYVAPGVYLVSTSTLASRIVNAPFTNKGYKMTVDQYRSGNYYKQTIFAWAEPSAFYIRTRGGGSIWSAWYKFDGTSVTP